MSQSLSLSVCICVTCMTLSCACVVSLWDAAACRRVFLMDVRVDVCCADHTVSSLRRSSESSNSYHTHHTQTRTTRGSSHQPVYRGLGVPKAISATSGCTSLSSSAFLRQYSSPFPSSGPDPFACF